MRVYLDNNATTPIHPEVLDSLTTIQRETFGNPSSVHGEGRAARRLLEEAREPVAELIGASPREIVFTSGGTESNNAAIFGVAGASNGLGNIVVSTIEHPSVLGAAAELERRGHRVTRVSCDSRGVVSAAEVVERIDDRTTLVTVMLANNETGTIQPVAEIARVCRERGIHFHCDAVQAAGKISLDVKALAVDSLSLSGHKFHAPKGVGALYVREGLSLSPQIVGGSQERRRRAGTENAPLAAALGFAARLALPSLEEAGRISGLRDRLEQQLAGRGARSNGSGASRLPNTSNMTFPGADAEAIVIALDLSGVAVSTGSACSSGRVEPSHVLIAMGLSVEDARSSIRFSLSRFTTAGEIDQTVALLQKAVPAERGEEAH